MRIAMDARWIFPEISGIGAYTRELIRQLALLDRQNDYLLLFCDPAVRERTRAETGIAAAPNFTLLDVPYGLFTWQGQVRLPALLARHGVDLYHSTNYLIPLRRMESRGRRIRSVATVHDVIPLLFPDHAPRSRKARLFPLYRWIMRRIGRVADAIISDSRASAADVARCLGIPAAAAGKLHPIYCGVSPRFRPAGTRAAGGDSARVRRLLYVGRMDPYKNVPMLVRAFAAARGACPFPLELVVAGSPDPRYPEARAVANELGVADRVTWTGYLSDDALLALYQGADLLVHPSRYEGFGLPVVEAMACGVPVVCSNAGSLAEVASDAALQVSPDDGRGFGEAIVKVLTDPALAARMRARGLERARCYTWEETARQTLAVYAGPAEGRW